MGKIYNLELYKQQKIAKILTKGIKQTQDIGYSLAEFCYYLSDKAMSLK